MNSSMNKFFNELTKENILSKGSDYVDAIRKDFFWVDKNEILSNNGKIFNIEDIAEGVNTLIYKDKRFDIFFKKNCSDKLVVTFDGARTSNGGEFVSIPSFPRWSWFPFIDANFLCMEDPMYFEHDNLKIGWFFGNKKENYRLYCAEIIKQISTKLGIKEIILYGSSGGGSVAIAVGALINDSRVVAINPQTMFHLFPYASTFETITGIELEHDNLNRNNVFELITQSTTTRYLLIYNIRSKDDIENHCKPLANMLGMDVKYGLNKKDNIDMWIYDVDSENPHTAFESYIEYSFIRDFYNFDTEVQKYLVLWINEIWKKRSESNKRNNIVMKKFERKNIVRDDYMSFVFKCEGKYSHRCIATLPPGIYWININYNVLSGNQDTEVTIMVRSKKDHKCINTMNIKSGSTVKIYCESDLSELLLYGGVIGETELNIIDFISVSVLM